jgi:hypothetical protein
LELGYSTTARSFELSADIQDHLEDLTLAPLALVLADILSGQIFYLGR